MSWRVWEKELQIQHIPPLRTSLSSLTEIHRCPLIRFHSPVFQLTITMYGKKTLIGKYKVNRIKGTAIKKTENIQILAVQPGLLQWLKPWKPDTNWNVLFPPNVLNWQNVWNSVCIGDCSHVLLVFLMVYNSASKFEMGTLYV